MFFLLKRLIFSGFLILIAFKASGYDVADKARPRSASADKTARIRIIHTNDIHSSIDILPKLSAFIEEQKKLALEAGMFPIVDDAGDFFSGSIMHVIAPRNIGDARELNPELEFLRRHDYVGILGNHEWDATQEGLGIMMSKLSGERSFPGGMLASNIVLRSPKKGGSNALSPYFFNGIMILDHNGQVVKAYSLSRTNRSVYPVDENELPQATLTRAVLHQYKVGDKEFNVGFIGVMGPNAITGSEITRKDSGVSFKEYDSKYVARLVGHLRDLGAELVIAICHAGKQPDGIQGPEEDKDLWKKIPGIDVVSAGHTHVGYPAKKEEAPLIRYQSPASGQAVVTDLSYDVKKEQVRTLSIDASKIIYTADLQHKWDHSEETYRSRAKISPDEIETYKNEFDNIVKDDDRYTLDPTLLIKHNTELIYIDPETEAAKELGDFRSYETRIPLGKFVTTAVREEINEVLLKENKKPLDIVLTGIELVRIPFPVATPTLFSDIFAMLSRGVMKAKDGDLIPDGGKIAVMSMSKRDLYRLVGLFEYYSRKYTVEATMAYSEGLEFIYDPSNIPIFNNLRNFKLNGEDYEDLPDILRVGISSFIAQNIREKAGGLVDFALIHQIAPKDHKMTMDVLLARYLYKNRNLLETQGVAGSAFERERILSDQKDRWRDISLPKLSSKGE
jgi:2',3'-cyclic-nucleotide 2'-phosphodiesterase (5'-nucleotidase family)